MTKGITARKKLSWSLIFVSAGEITLCDHAQTVGKRTNGGAEVRLLNVEADAGIGMGLFENTHGSESPDVFSRRLKDAARRYYGSPLRSYLSFLAANRVELETALRKSPSNFVNDQAPEGASGEVYRAATRFALIAVAGELATEAGITGWKPGEATDAAALCLRDWIARRETTGSSDDEEAIKQVRSFLEAHGSSRFQLSPQRRPAHAGSRDDAGNTVAIVLCPKNSCHGRSVVIVRATQAVPEEDYPRAGKVLMIEMPTRLDIDDSDTLTEPARLQPCEVDVDASGGGSKGIPGRPSNRSSWEAVCPRRAVWGVGRQFRCCAIGRARPQCF
jgi:hypothetical protein